MNGLDDPLDDRLRRLGRAAVAAQAAAEAGLRELSALRSRLEALRARHLEVLEALELSDDEYRETRARLDSVLVALGNQVDRPGSPQRRDRILAGGEDLSAHLTAAVLRSVGVDAQVVDAREVLPTDDHFGAALPQRDMLSERARARLEPLLAGGTTAIVQGFVGADPQGRTTTLGRGGSDHSAVLLGAALRSCEVVIWTDVAGMHTADPGAVEGVRVIPELGFEEAVELSYFGAKVLQPAAAKHAVAEGVPLRIRDARHPDLPGTVVRHDTRGVSEFAAVAYKPHVVLIEVRAFPSAVEHGFLARVFEVLARHEVPVDLVATSHSSTAFTVDEGHDLTAVRAELARFATVEIQRGRATVTVVGRGLLSRPGMDAQTFWAIGDTPVHLISQASDVSLSFVVNVSDAASLIRRLHAALIDAGDAAREAAATPQATETGGAVDDPGARREETG